MLVYQPLFEKEPTLLLRTCTLVGRVLDRIRVDMAAHKIIFTETEENLKI